MSLVSHVTGLRSVRAVHVSEDELLALADEAVGQVDVLLVDLLDAGLNVGGGVDDEGGEDDSGIGGGGVEVVDEVSHAGTGVANVVVLDGVVGAEVDGVDVGVIGRDIGLGVALDIGDLEAGVSLALVVGHVAAGLGAYHVDGEAVVLEGGLEVLAVTVAIGGEVAEGDRGTEGHENKVLIG